MGFEFGLESTVGLTVSNVERENVPDLRGGTFKRALSMFGSFGEFDWRFEKSGICFRAEARSVDGL